MNNQSQIEINPMEDNAISEIERLRIEQVQLEDEELEVESVEDDESSDDDRRVSAGASASDQYTYDTSLVTLHSYLGEVEDTHSRLAFLDGGAVLTLPLIYQEGAVLFPEATFPLRAVFSYYIAAIERAMRQVDARYIIGVVPVSVDPNNGRVRLSPTGTTAEIRQYRKLEDGSVNIVARGQQRFRLKRCWFHVEGLLCGKVHIIQEDTPLRTPRAAVGKLPPLRHSQTSSMSRIPHSSNSEVYDESTSSNDERSERFYECQSERSSLANYAGPVHLGLNKQNADDSPGVGKRSFLYMQPSKKVGWEKHSIAQFRDVPRAFWPGWVYRMYDSYVLARKAADRWKQVAKAPNMDSLVMKPDLLSFHIASKLPVSKTARQELLEIDETICRLRKEIELLESFDKMHCKTCETPIAKRSDMLVMSSDGPLGLYANPNSYVHEVMTVTKTSGITVTGPPHKEFSWFPGYSWSLAECIMCEWPMGWYFSATKKEMRPRAFWGLRSSQVADETLKKN